MIRSEAATWRPGSSAEIPGAELEIVPDGGHAVWIDEPDRVAARTKRFLAATPNE